ncbi:serine O-acetyltransferase [Dechloromonas denitrificans]|uniref:serine O-acetyltransferase n=1 Tax=Dechloromonas denitrificans TaxID=281362 RepID=UPI001CF82401|nr:serine O-acetyltransferase [Dechloromonas denitrificans]UCV05489.1 serine acetyltransferase [Dechloromonas denitrificans]UCV09835.1 serine acetyltransferase [Dechloromonas denitrificans]
MNASESTFIMNKLQRLRLIAIWKSDLHRHMQGKSDLRTSLKAYRLLPGFRFLVWLRLAASTQKSVGLWSFVHRVARIGHKHYLYKYGISIPYPTKIGSGFYIGHFGGIVVNEAAEIGRNCNISHGVTIGQLNRGERKGTPKIGDEVYIGPGAKIIGAIRIGNGCAIGANAVVTKDLPDKAVAVGIPARIISYAGAEGYVEYCDYPPIEAGKL